MYIQAKKNFGKPKIEAKMASKEGFGQDIGPGAAAECNPPHSITLCYDCTAKHYLGGKLLVIVKLNCTEIFYPKSANTAENAVNLRFTIYEIMLLIITKDKHTFVFEC